MYTPSWNYHAEAEKPTKAAAHNKSCNQNSHLCPQNIW